jgi:hypothetical protein
MEKVVPLLTTFRTICYFNFSESWKVLFGSFKICKVLKGIEPVEIRIWFKPI